MAKLPRHPQPHPSPSSSSSPSTSPSPHATHPPPHRHSSRTRPHTARKLHPSAAALAALATISAAASTVDGHPLDSQPPPPDFLCPLLSPDCSPSPSPPQLPSTSSSHRRSTRRDLATPPTDVRAKRASRPFVPLKYEQGEDGRWRKSSSWSLYGSAFCGNTQCLPEDTNIPVVDDQIQPSQTATVTHTTDDTDMTSFLPPGWPPKTTDDHISPPVIVGLALVLALVICGFMIGCIFWRKKRRAKARELVDLEQKRKAKLYDEDSEEEDEENEELRRARSQQRMWSKATARWRANVRISARRRRAQRSLATRADSTTTHTASTSMASLHSMSSSTSVSRRNLSASVANDTTLADPSSHGEEPHGSSSPTRRSRPASPDADILSIPPSSPPPPPPPLHPPAYQTDSRRRSRTSLPLRLPDISDASGTQGTHALSSAEEDDDHPSYPHSDAAHIATDDKGLLARIAALASAPPAESQHNHYSDLQHQAESGASSAPAVIYPSVPVLDEVEVAEGMEMDSPGLLGSRPEASSSPSSQHQHKRRRQPHSDSEDDTDAEDMAHPPAPSYSHSHDGSSNVFPLPPAKSRLAAPLFYEYPSSFEEDVVGTEPSFEPSAPPFEVAAAAPSAPPMDLDFDGVVVPSAPPEEDDNDENPALAPGAPSEAVIAISSSSVEAPESEEGELLPPSGSRAQSHSGTQRRSPPDYLP